MNLATTPDSRRTTISDPILDVEQAQQGAAVLLDYENNSGWSSILKTLAIWSGQYSPLAEEEDLTPPSALALSTAVAIVRNAMAASVEAPRSVVATGDGGVAFEYRNEPLTQVLDVAEDGSAEWIVFDGLRLIEKSRL